MKLINSPVTTFNFENRIYYVKRDDLLDPGFSGNKARKLAYFLNKKHLELEKITALISYGGNQSTLMYALSSLARINHWQFVYYTPKLFKIAKDSLTGNLKASLENGMEFVEIEENFSSFCQKLSIESNQLITQGGAQKEAEFGIKVLADEIQDWAIDNKLSFIQTSELMFILRTIPILQPEISLLILLQLIMLVTPNKVCMTG